jgi:5-formyltetrahydrofolate cyclo-ligase
LKSAGIVRAKSIHQLHLKSEQKTRLRAEALSLRKKIWLKSGGSAAQAIAGKGVPLIQSFGLSGAIGGYHAIRAELDPLPLLAALHANGFCIALPCVSEGDDALTFREWMPGSDLKRGKFGVAEPAATQPATQPSILFVPLVAFDRKGNRLGYGAGYYDASLRDMRARQPVLAIGVAFDEQEFPDIPREPQDEPLDMILTPKRVLACRN